MDCSRCGGDLEVYSLGENEAYVCVDCGFVGTPVEHTISTQSEPEPWERALQRFYEKHVGGDAAIVGSGETAALVEIDRSQEPTVIPTDETDDTNDEHAGAQLVNGDEKRDETTDAGGDVERAEYEADHVSDSEQAAGEEDDTTEDTAGEADDTTEDTAGEADDTTEDTAGEADDANDDSTASDEQAA